MEQSFQLINNKLTFKQLDTGGQIDGINLSSDEKEYLLPHFLMLLVGKPGSGKTTLLRQLLSNNMMYNKKFDDVFIVSPSHSKMGIKTKKDHTTASFSLDWIFEKIDEINEEQLENVFGSKLHTTTKEKSRVGHGKNFTEALLNDSKSRFLLGDMYKTTPGAVNVSKTMNMDKPPKKQHYDKDVFMQKKYEELKAMPREQQESSHRDVLFVFDDVVGSIKKAEFDPRLAQLAMNRRHLVFNGTISIIVVTQKYSLIPTRIRSNASWIIVFQLNPADFEAMYRDSVVLSQNVWRQVLAFVFGKELLDDKGTKSKTLAQKEDAKQQEEQKETETIENRLKIKKFENLGLWVELNVFFKNFKRIQI